MSFKLNFWSASVAVALAPSVAFASDAPKKVDAPASPPKKVSSNNPLEISVTGAGVFSDFRDGFGIDGDYDSVSDAKMGLSPDTRALGAYGAISIGRKMDNPDYDWKLSGAFTNFGEERASTFGYSYDDLGFGGDGSYAYDLFGFSETAMGFQTLDFDLGHRFSDSGVSGRVFGGIRALHMTDSSSVGLSKVGTGPSIDGSVLDVSVFSRHDFVGIGPRIGAEAQTQGQLSFKASVAAAVIYGQSDRTYGVGVLETDGTSTYGIEFSGLKETSYDWITDVEGTLGLVYSPSEQLDFEAGYRAEHLGGVDNSQQENVLVHGPYFKVGVKF